MPIDVSRKGAYIQITKAAGTVKRLYPNKDYYFEGDGDLKILGETPIPLSQLTVNGIAPANVAAALLALESVFTNVGGGTIRNADAGYVFSKLTSWNTKFLNSPSTVKIAYVGDSTSDIASNAIGAVTQLTSFHTKTGDYLEGFNSPTNFLNFGASGNTLANFLVNAPTGKGINDVIAAAPDLIIFSYGINDVRTSAEASIATLRANIVSAINIMRAALPNTDFVLRMPNSLLGISPNGYIIQGGYGSLAAAGQAKSNILYEAYADLLNRWDNVLLINQQDLIFGRKSQLAASALMVDELHPYAEPAVDLWASVIGKKEVYSAGLAKAALAAVPSTPWTYYPKYVEDKTKYAEVARGRMSALNTTTLGISSVGLAQKTNDDLRIGDIINVADRFAFAIPSTFTPTVQNANSLLLQFLGGVLPTTNLPTGGDVVIYRPLVGGVYQTSISDVVATATDAAYTVGGSSQIVKLPTITANRIVTLPAAAAHLGRTLKIWNQGATGFTWTYAGALVKDATNTTVTTIPNQTWHHLESDGTNWNKLN